MSEKRYYWLKLQKDFFKRHDIKYIETLPNGREITHFYLKLMVESVDHEGELRFSPELPYSEAMLASVTDTPTDIVEAGMAVLKELGLVKVDEDGTIVLPKVVKMIDSAADTDGARRVRRFRERQQEKLQNVTPALQNVTATVTNDNESKSKSKSKSIEIDTKRESKERETRSLFVPPTVDEVYDYCEGRHNDIDSQRFVDYYSARGWKNITDWKAQVRVWESKVGIPASEF